MCESRHTGLNSKHDLRVRYKLKYTNVKVMLNYNIVYCTDPNGKVYQKLHTTEYIDYHRPFC